MKIVVIGAGPAGETAARFAAKQKAEVLLIKKQEVDGLCLNRGCIPSKTFLSYAKKIHEFKRLKLFNKFLKDNFFDLRQQFWKEVQHQKKEVIENLKKGLTQTT